MNARIVLLCLLVFVSVKSPLVADHAETLRERLKTAEFVVIAVYSQRSHEFPIVLAAFGTPDKSDFEWLRNLRTDVTLLAIPGQPVLRIRSSPNSSFGTEFNLPLSGKVFEMEPFLKGNEISFPFGNLPGFIQSFQNPLLKKSFVKKDWVKFVPEQEPDITAEFLKERMAQRKAEWEDRAKEEKEEPQRNRPFFR